MQKGFCIFLQPSFTTAFEPDINDLPDQALDDSTANGPFLLLKISI
jgi:hypothetical protein